ncbi:hypothetical protein JXA32_07845 [Candidatus Sumerlaeota bacterium]|nr:hypothetical protein [Candidatus Sumerlaeota bacterium]
MADITRFCCADHGRAESEPIQNEVTAFGPDSIGFIRRLLCAGASSQVKHSNDIESLIAVNNMTQEIEFGLVFFVKKPNENGQPILTDCPFHRSFRNSIPFMPLPPINTNGKGE